MTPQRRVQYKKHLERLRRDLLGQAPVRPEPNRRDGAEVGVADEDAQALSEMLQAIGSQRNKGQSERVARIDRALRKLAENPDEYGACEECGEEIAARRLDAIPEATLCTDCQAAHDPRRGGRRRSVTDYR